MIDFLFGNNVLPMHLILTLSAAIIIFFLLIIKKMRRSEIAVSSVIGLFIIGGVALMFVYMPGLIKIVQLLTGVETTTNAVFLLSIGVLGILVVSQFIKIEKLQTETKKLNQEVAILKNKVERKDAQN